MKTRRFPNFLKIVTIDEAKKIRPFEMKISENVTYYVADHQLIRALSEILDFKFEILIPPDGEYGYVKPDGNWTGMVGMVQREEADVSIGRMLSSYSRSLVVDLAYPYQFSPATFITDKLKYSHDKSAILKPFSPFVWLAVVFSLIIMLAIAWFLVRRKFTPPNFIMDICGSLFRNSVTFQPRKLSIKLLILSWAIGTKFLAESYQAVFLSFLTFPSLFGIRNIAELKEASQESSFLCSTYEGSFLPSYFLESKDETLKKIAECLIRTDVDTNDIAKFLSSYKNVRKSFIGLRIDLLPFEHKYFISEDTFQDDFVIFAVRKSFCCKDILDDMIHKMAAYGLLLKYENDEIFFSRLILDDLLDAENNSVRILTLQDFSEAFICLISGYILGIIVLLTEILIHKYC